MTAASQWHFDAYHLDLDNALLWQGEQTITLRPKAFEVLVYLVEHAGKLVSKDAILETVWAETAVSESVLKGCIGEIRKALHDSVKTPRFIATVHRRGYRFIPAVTAAMPLPVASAPASPLSLPPSSAPERAISGEPLSASRPPVVLVSRETELVRLHQWLDTVLQGERRIGFIAGEAGIGKTALVDAFVTQIDDRSALWIGRGQCVEQYGAGEAYLPLLEAFGHLVRSPGGARIIKVLNQQAPSWLVQMPALLAACEVDTLQQQDRGLTRERMLRELAGAVETLTAEQPMVLVLEDLHWSDVSTLDWLAYMARRRTSARLLVLGTYRPGEAIGHSHPLPHVTQALRLHNECEELSLSYLPESGIESYLTHRFGQLAMADHLARVLYQRTNGNPLFMINVVEDALRQDVLRQDTVGWTLPEGIEGFESGVPESLRQMIEQQVSHLEPEEQEFLQAASVAGMAFSAAAVAAAIGQPVEAVESQGNGLARRGQLVQRQGPGTWPDGTLAETYRFIHALYQESLYDQVGASRRVRWHREIGSRQEVGYGAQAPTMAAELAVHFVRGRDPRRAVRYLRQAADTATRRHAPQEAIDHLTLGLDLLPLVPDTPERLQHELAMQTPLGTALVATTGPASPEVEGAYSQARALARRIGDVAQLFPALVGLWDCYLVRAEHHRARELGEQLETMAQRELDPTLLLEAHRTLGTSLLFCGDLTSARRHLEESLALYQPHQHHSLAFLYGQDPGVICRLHTAMTLWLLGYADQARHQIDEAVALANAQAHPFSQVFALNYAAQLHQSRREVQRTQERMEALRTVASDYAYPFFLARATTLEGWVLAQQGQGEAGIAQLRQGLEEEETMRGGLARSRTLALLAETYGRVGQAALGLSVLDQALGVVSQTGEQYWEAELHRLKGELLWHSPIGDLAPAEAYFERALAIAHQQRAKSLELRAATSLARLWQSQGKRQDARELLAPVYEWFTEGFDTADLQDAKALLNELEG